MRRFKKVWSATERQNVIAGFTYKGSHFSYDEDNRAYLMDSKVLFSMIDYVPEDATIDIEEV